MARDTRDGVWITPHSPQFTKSAHLLLKKFVEGQGMCLCLSCNNSRIFSATTATVLLALHHIGKLTDEMRAKFHDALFACKDQIDEATRKQGKHTMIAWDTLEGLSPWVTSLAIWALLGTKYRGERLGEIKDAVFWLIEQQRADGRWGRLPYDATDMLSTSIAFHALRIAMRASALRRTNAETERIRRAGRKALETVRKLSQQKGKTVFWRGQTEHGIQGDATATLCAIWVLHQAGDFDREHRESDLKLIHGGIQYLRETLVKNAQPGEPPIWSFERVIISPPIQGPAWTIVSFTPSFIIPLLAMGCDPFDEVCFAPLRWLQQAYLEDEMGWGHENYGHSKDHALSYTTAYALWAIFNWYKYAARRSVQQQRQLQRVRQQRNFALILLIVISISYFLPQILSLLAPISIGPFFDWLNNANGALQLISALLGILSFLFLLLKFVDDKFFGKKITGFWNKLLRS